MLLNYATSFHQNLKISSSFFSDFRLNKYCGEHLLIGNEKQSEDDFTKTKERKGEPVAEARIQTDQSFHHLKILKSGDSNDSQRQIVPNEKEHKRRKNHRVYSQVTFLKIVVKLCQLNHYNHCNENEFVFHVGLSDIKNSP